MRWIDITEDQIVPKPRAMPKTKAEPVQPAVPVANGPIAGIPAADIEAWVDSWDTDQELPPPKARQLE